VFPEIAGEVAQPRVRGTDGQRAESNGQQANPVACRRDGKDRCSHAGGGLDLSAITADGRGGHPVHRSAPLRTRHESRWVEGGRRRQPSLIGFAAARAEVARFWTGIVISCQARAPQPSESGTISIRTIHHLWMVVWV